MSKPPKIPNVAWRDGRPRFMPGEPLRRLGWKGEDLKHPDGRWYSAGEALDWARRRSEEIARQRGSMLAEANGKRPKGTRPLRTVPVVYTLAKLFDDWQRSPKWLAGETIGKRAIKPLAEATKKSYRYKMRAIESFDHDLYHSAVEALDATILYGLFEELWQDKGLSTARGCIATISSAISWGRKRGRVRLAINPAEDLGMQMPDIVVRFGERDEIAALVAAADACGRPEIGDMVTLGLWTGQRQTDRLVMVEHGEGLVRGRRILRQSKTGAVVAVLQSPELKRRLTAAAERRAAAGVSDRHIVLDERQWKPWKEDHYRHTYADIRTVAAAGLKVGETMDEAIARWTIESGTAGTSAGRRAVTAAQRAGSSSAEVATLWRLRPCPSVATLADRHLRATAVVWMALAGATIPEIVSVSGHTPASAHTILKHYLARHPEMADSAIGKMIAWHESGEAPGIVR